jgi:multidrug efflux system membrane fusion protein
MSRLWRVVLAVGGILGAFVLYEVVTRFVAYTSDGYVRSDLIAVAPQVTGRIIAVHVIDNQTVKRGDPLVTIDPVPFQLVVAQRAALMSASPPATPSPQHRIGCTRRSRRWPSRSRRRTASPP